MNAIRIRERKPQRGEKTYTFVWKNPPPPAPKPDPARKFDEGLTISPMGREEPVATCITHTECVQDLTQGVRVNDGFANLDYKRLDSFHALTDSTRESV